MNNAESMVRACYVKAAAAARNSNKLAHAGSEATTPNARKLARWHRDDARQLRREMLRLHVDMVRARDGWGFAGLAPMVGGGL